MASAAGDRAAEAVGFLEGALQGVGVAAEVDDVVDGAVGVLEEGDDEGVAEDGADLVEVDGADAVDVADRPGYGPAAEQGEQVDVEEGLDVVA